MISQENVLFFCLDFPSSEHYGWDVSGTSLSTHLICQKRALEDAYTEAPQIKIFIQMETKKDLSDDQFKVIGTYALFYTIDLLIFDHNL